MIDLSNYRGSQCEFLVPKIIRDGGTYFSMVAEGIHNPDSTYNLVIYYCPICGAELFRKETHAEPHTG